MWDHNHFLRKGTLNHLAKLTKWLSCVVSTYLYGAFDCMLLSSHVRISEWIYTLQLPKFQAIPCLKQAWYLKLKWQQRDSNPQPFSSKKNTQPFGLTDQMIELCYGYLPVWCIWLYVILMLRTCSRVNLQSIVTWILRNSLFETGAISKV